jgi:hypothetical protein
MSDSIPSSPSPIDIQALLVEFDCSGRSAAAFARSKGLPPWKLYNALRRRSGKLRSRRAVARAERSALLPVHVVDAPPAQQPTAMELVLAGGHRLLIRSDFDALALRRLVEALAQC